MRCGGLFWRPSRRLLGLRPTRKRAELHSLLGRAAISYWLLGHAERERAARAAEGQNEQSELGRGQPSNKREKGRALEPSV